MADRAFRRHPRLGGWVRAFEMTIKVAEPDRWHAVSPALTRAVSFLSDDNWQFTFEDIGRRSPRPVRAHERPIDDKAAYGPVALFSGGLDSFCGACKLLLEARDQPRRPIFVTSYVKARRRLSGLLQDIAGFENVTAFEHLPIQGEMVGAKAKGLRAVELPERSRRTRSLYYLMKALAAAIEFRAGEIHLYENGILALNLPMRPSDTGSRATRHAHPYFLKLVNALFQELRGQNNIAVLNPFVELTKSEILRFSAGSESLIGDTVTCWGYPNATLAYHGATHCGHCLPCLIRRFALAANDISEVAKIYHDSKFLSMAKKNYPKLKPDTWSEARKLMAFVKWVDNSKPSDMPWTFGGSLLHLAPEFSKTEIEKIWSLYRRFANEVNRVVKAA